MSRRSAFQKLDAYTGPITIDQAAEGISAAIRNARSLLRDSDLLFTNARWPRSASLAVLAIEEAGKLPLLRSLLLVDSPRDIKDEWRAYRSHTKKNVMGAMLEHLRADPHIEDLRALFDGSSDHPQLLDAVKQIGFYWDCLGDVHWSVPEEVVDQALARSLLATARSLVPQVEAAMTSLDELQLWVKHLKPVWRADGLAMKQGLIACYQEASDLGVLRSKEPVEAMVAFLL